MSIQINDEDGIKKIFAFLKVASKAEFHIAIDIAEVVIYQLRDFAVRNDLRIEIYNPSREKIFYFCTGGVIAGAAAGYLIGAFPGLAIGLVAGGFITFGLSKVQMVLRKPENGDDFLSLTIV